ncbi:response regulator [Haloferula sp.]|uniref:response regulator n=1 Tax=Haloferula sp. TaxID=2497595 RepID=UPI003C73FC7F
MKEDARIRILIADDHYVVRMGLVALVNTEADMEVVAEAEDGEKAVELFDQHQPDLVLIDSQMPNMNGVEATIEIRKRSPEARILMLTAYDGDADIRRALDAGVNGYVLKRSTGENLIPALRTVAAGGRWLSKAAAGELSLRKSYEQLTPREVQVLAQLAKGMANKQVAEALQISEYTVKDHVKNILAKLRVGDRTEAVTVAIKRGFIRL